MKNWRLGEAGVYHNCSTRFADGFRYGAVSASLHFGVQQCIGETQDFRFLEEMHIVKIIYYKGVGSSQLRSRSSSPWGAWLFFLALVKMTIGPLILSADMLDFISIISVR